MNYEIWKHRGEIDMRMCSKGGKIYLRRVLKHNDHDSGSKRNIGGKIFERDRNNETTIMLERLNRFTKDELSEGMLRYV